MANFTHEEKIDAANDLLDQIMFKLNCNQSYRFEMGIASKTLSIIFDAAEKLKGMSKESVIKCIWYGHDKEMQQALAHYYPKGSVNNG